MWEFSLFLDNQVQATKFYEIAKYRLKKHKGVITQFENQVLFAFPNKSVKSCIESSMIYFVITNYKTNYFMKKLSSVNLSDIKKEALIKVLTMFDNEFDIMLLSDELKINKELNLSSFMNFRMQHLLEKWNEIISLIINNSFYLFCSETYNDLLKFLLNTLDTKWSEVNIIFKDDQLYVFDKSFQKCLIKESDSRLIIMELIGFSPKIINIYCSKIVENPIFNIIIDIFQDKVKIICNN